MGGDIKGGSTELNLVLKWGNARSLSEYWNFRGCWKMCRCKAREILRNESYMKVRRSDEG